MTERHARYVLALIMGIIAALYARSWDVLPFADDWWHIARAHDHGFAIFFPEQFFRPFERFANAVNYSMFEVIGPVTIACCIATLLLTALAVFRLARTMAPEHASFAYLAAVLFVAHPGNASAVIQIDTLSQCLAALFSVLCVQHVVFSESVGLRDLGLRAAALAFLTLCAKETAVGFVCALPLVTYLKLRYRDGYLRADALRTAAAVAIAVIAALVAYLLIRLALNAALSGDESGRYAFTSQVGLLIANASRLFGGSFFIGDSAHGRVWKWDPESRIGVCISIAFIGTLLLGLTAYRRIPQPARRIRGVDIALCGALVVSGLFPALLLSQVSEQYLPGLTPFSSLVSAAALCWLAQRWRPQADPGLAFLILIALYTGWCANVIDNKQRMHAELSARHWGFVRELVAALPACGTGAQDLTITGDLDAMTQGVRSYSVFGSSNLEILTSVMYGLRDSHIEPLIRRQSSAPGRSAFGAAADASHCELVRAAADACEIRCLGPDAGDRALRSCRIGTGCESE